MTEVGTDLFTRATLAELTGTADDFCWAAEVWPRLSDLALSDDVLEARRDGIGGSDANTILSGDGKRIEQLWAEKRGELEPSDLSGILPVALGTWTEPFNRQWFERQTGELIAKVGHTATCSEHPWRRCTLDGFLRASNSVWEAKHTSAFANRDEVLQRYMPQLQHNMAVMKADRAVLSIIFDNHKYEIVGVASDWLYQIELLEAESDFWDCVQTGRLPPLFAAPAPPRPVGVREVCLEGNNRWAVAAAEWLQNRISAKIHAAACTEIKSLVEPDVARAFGHGIEAKRSKAGALSIKELTQ